MLKNYGREFGGQGRLFIKYIESPKKIGKVDYMIYFKKSEFYEQNKEILFENVDVIYENEAGGIVKK
jgi:hypothetical protein